MYLDVGEVDRIDNPTAEHVRQFLRVMPPRSPFVILTAADELFMQATPVHSDADRYRVEYREVDRQYVVHVDYDRAVDLFERFRRSDASFRTVVSWRRLRRWSDPYNALAPAVVLLLLSTVLLLGWWLTSR